MSSIITDARGLVKQPKDPYWDSPVTRREMQIVINDIALNEEALTNRSDTANIVLNMICEKLGVTRAEIDAFVERKKAQIAALSAQANPSQANPEAANEQSKG